MTRTQFIKFANQEIKKHTSGTWTFSFCKRSKSRLGTCNYTKKIIKVSDLHFEHDSIEQCIDTLHHEIAHAVAGHEAGHGRAWEKIAVALGATPSAYGASNVRKEASKYFLVYPEGKQIIARALTARNKWVKSPQHYCIKGRPETRGKLIVLTASQINTSEYTGV